MGVRRVNCLPKVFPHAPPPALATPAPRTVTVYTDFLDVAAATETPPTLVEVDELPATERGVRGFGSSAV